VVEVCLVINKIPTQEEKECADRSFLDYDPDTGFYLPCTQPTRAYVVSKFDPDTLTWPQAMMSDNSEGFWQAMQKEVSSLQQLGTWSVVRREPGFNVLASTWAFKRKRYPDGRLKSLKARFCVRGDQQLAGKDYFESCSSVVQWSTVHVVLALVAMFELDTHQVDYNNAFAQASIKKDVYVTMPRGFEPSDTENDYVLRLNKSLYGLARRLSTTT
jgi:hypothetical protein